MLTIGAIVKASHDDFIASVEQDRFYSIEVNGEPKKMLGCDLQILSMILEVYRKHPEIPLADGFYIDPEGSFTDKTMRGLFERIILPTIDDIHINKKKLWRSCFEAYNSLYNFGVTDLLPYIDSIDVFAIMELLNDKELSEVNKKIQAGEVDVEVGWNLFRQLSKTKHLDNPIIRALQYGTVPIEQLQQSIIAIGQVTDIDSVVFINELTRGFAMGYGDINSLVKSSRSAAKALLFNKDPVAASEYLNRKLQLVGNHIRRILLNHDCGTHDYHTVVLPEDKNTFEKFEGIAQVLPDGKIHYIEKTDTHLMGKRVHIRTTMCCRELEHQAVCSTCYGRMSYALLDDEETGDTSSPGQTSTIAICGPATQKVISTKHLDFIRCVINLILNPEDAKYLELHKSMDSLKLKEKHKDKRLMLHIDAEEARGLINLVYLNTLDGINLTTVTSLTSCEFVTLDDESYIKDISNATLQRQATNASLSLSMLKYIKQHGWTSEGKRYIIDLKDWNFEKPMFTYQLKHENMSAYVSRVELFIRSTQKDEQNKRDRRSRMTRLTRFDDPTEALMAGLALMTEKLDVNVAHIATVLAASRVMDPERGDWRIANGLHVGKFVAHDEIIVHRGLETAFLYEDQSKIFTNTKSYLERDRVGSPLKGLIYPAK